MKKANVVGSVLFILAIFSVGFGQQHTENKADQVLRGSGRVNASTLGMELEIPLGSYPGRGINVPISLSYSSKLWRMNYVSNQPEVNNPDNCIAINEPQFAENSAAGWTTSLATPYIEYTGNDNTFNSEGQPTGTDEIFCQPIPPPNTPLPQIFRVKRINIHLPGGETHELRDESEYAQGTFPASFDGIYHAADGSNIKYVQNSSNGTYRLLMPDGSFYDFAGEHTGLNQATIRKALKFSDRNGNFTVYNDADGTWTDTLGRVLAAPFGLTAPSNPITQTYTMPGMTGSYKFHWKRLKNTTAAESALTDFSLSLKYSGDKYLVNGQLETRTPETYLFKSIDNKFAVGLNELFNPVVLTGIELPTGQSYKFTYDIYGRIERINYPTGGAEEFEYSVTSQLSHVEAGDLNAQTNFGVRNRKVFQAAGQNASYEWTYNASTVAPNGFQVTITNPDGTRAVRYLHRSSVGNSTAFGYDSALAGMAYREDAFSGPNKLVSQKLTNWTVTQYSNGGFYLKDWHPRVTSEETRIFDDSNNGVSATTTFEYEGDLSLRETPVLMKKSAQFAFVVAGSQLPAVPVRTSETTFLITDENYPQWARNIYKAQNMIGLTTSTVVRDGTGTIVSRSETRYDDGDYSPNIGRGNPTNLRVWDSTKGNWNNPNAYISTRAKFDVYGNQYETIDARGVSTFTEFDSVHHAFPVRVVSAVPDPTGAHGSNTPFETTATFDWITGLPLTATNANGLETRITYDPVTLRPLNTKTFYQNAPVGGVSETVYHDEPNNFWIKSRTQIDADKWAENIAYFDGLGRAYKAEEINSEGSIYVEKEFDAEGRVSRVTNPFRAGEIKHWTTNVYDESSRIKEVILPDGARVRTDYGVLVSDIMGVTKTITDQAGKKRKGISDALGRMIRVIEDPEGQNLLTDYIFDTLGNLRKTIQGEQNRYFTYDSLGRLLFAKQPEQDANAAFAYTDSITGNAQWSVKYEYDANGNITRTTDANGTFVQGIYDNFNRLKTRDYSDATPDVNFYYDGKGLPSIPAFSKGKTTKVANGVSETQYTNFDVLGRLLANRQSTDGQTYNFSYQYNLTALVAETYPSGRTVSYEFDQDGDLARIAGQTAGGAKTYANSFKYNSSGAIESMRLGNGKWETAVYNERLQIMQIGLGNSLADASLLKLEYGYGTNQQNNGSMRSQKISFTGLTQPFEQFYSYDDLNRLLSAEEKVNNQTTWRQSFTYDRYGNRRFDANQTTTLAQSNNLTNPQIDPATNRFTSGQNYLYDKNGSLTHDAGGRQFLYDAEAHQREVRDANNQVVARYLYDGEGRRIKKVLLNTQEETIFVYNAGGKLAAEYVINPQTQAETPSTRYLTNDHLGSPRVVTNQLGKVINRKDFMAFGEEIYTTQRTTNQGYASTPDDSIRQGYTGYEKDDESGLDFAQARYYNSQHGRFTSVDPLVASANIKDPQTFNRFSYALNSPYKFTDPLGLISENTGANGQNSESQGPPRKRGRSNKKQTVKTPKRLAPNRNYVVPANVSAEAGKTTVSGSSTTADGNFSEDVTIVLPDSMIQLKKELAKFAYSWQAAAVNQEEANKKTGSILPNQGTISESTKDTRGNSQTSSVNVDIDISATPGVKSSYNKGDSSSREMSLENGNQLSGPSTNITGTLNNIEVETNRAIGNYLDANADINGYIVVETINSQGKKETGLWSRQGVERHLKTFVQSVRNQASANFGGN